ncbi:uncharacterized protein LOC113350134 [Papaver somniferum]|uniref:uncharacterized protein LOC113350134 n=1 Tax=Papaver somniferum TaxID=3469 RepID=UPI000E6FF2D1|nr:uncharacterized protein LOC113350134 [Papaver somniferum]
MRDLKIYVCDYWRNLTPRSIRFRHGKGSDKAVINCDYSLHVLIAVTCSKELPSFDFFVEEVSNGGASSSSSGTSTQSLSDDESCSGFTKTSKIKCLTEGHEQLKPLLSDGWEDIFKGVGQIFHGGVDEVRLAVSKYCSKYGYSVAKVKNDGLRFTGKYGRDAECPWYLHCIPIDTSKSAFAIKEFNGEHKCGGAYKLKDPPVKKKLIKHLFKDQIQSNPSIKPNDMVAQVKSCYGINIKYHHAYKGKEASKAEIYGDDVKSYAYLVWYVEAIKATNPGRYIKFEYDKQTKRFERIFICFAACIEGYRFILPMIYCDATFLTGRFKGTLMAATGVNGNQGFFPFAYALVHGEDIEGWEWFMENLQHCVDSRHITFITDRHEGMKQSSPKYFPNSYHSYRFYHLKNNLPIKKSHEKYKQVLDLFHKATYCYSVAKYESALNEICIIGCGWVAKYLRNIDPKHWANAFFVGCRYGTHSSSIAESFNNWIHRERDLPPTALVDEIRIKIMRMSAERRELGRNYHDSLTHIYKALLKSHVDIGLPWNVTESGNGIYEVQSPSSHVVDLMQMTCTCQRLKVFGFPCAHATAAITMNGNEMLRFIQPYFGSNHFRNSSAPAIQPIPNYDRPEAYEPEERVLPGIPRPPPGRPPKKRIRSAYEKERRPMKFSNCKKIGNHNKATCRVLML